MLREIGEHHSLISFVRNEDVARRLDNLSTKCPEWCDFSAISKDLVAERSALVAGIAKSSRALDCFEFDELVVSFHDFELLKDSKLHCSTSLLSAKAAVAPDSQHRLICDLSLEITAHT